jgi:hypothetical protein
MNERHQRRSLVFNDLDEVIRDAETLLAKGYEKTGNWDLAQCCNHLADWLRFPVEGFPKMPLFLKPFFWMARKTIGRKKLLQYINTRSFPAGKPTMPETVKAPGGDPREAVAALRKSVERLKAHNGPIVPSPLFGPMTKDEAVRMQLVHCAHHLSFLLPKSV